MILYYVLFFTLFPITKQTELKYLDKVGEVSFPLDNVTGFKAFTLQYWEDFNSKKKYLCVINFPARSYNLKFYNYDTGILDFSVELNTEGPNSTGIYPLGFHVHNRDSIFIFSDREGQLSIIDQKGTVKSKHLILDTSGNKVPSGFVSTSHPMVYHDRKIYINGFFREDVLDHTKVKQDICLNLETGDFEYIIPRPKLYNDGFWGSHYLTRIYHSYNNKEESLLISFGADPNIYRYTINDLTSQAIECRSKYLGRLKPLGSKGSKHAEESKFKYEGTSGSYGAIIYDSYQELYYRIVQLPSSDSKYKFSPKLFKGTSLIIMNSQFKIIGEDLLPNEYDPYMFFVNEKGLHLANKSKYDQDEDNMVFDIFKTKVR